MGNYNPRAPYVIGNEWVPIRQERFRQDDITETGYTFYLDHGTVIVSGSNSIAEVTPASSIDKVFLNAVYPAGLDDLTGPVRQVVIPVDRVTVTGAGVGGSVSDFLTPSDNFDAFISATNFGEGIGLSFNVADYSNELSGKRILNVELLYVAYGDPLDMARVRVDIGRAAFAAPSAFQTFTYQEGLEGPGLSQGAITTEINSISFTDVNPFWSTSYTPSTSRERFPWRYQELSLLDGTATPSNAKLQVSLLWDSIQDSLDPVFIKYAALRVTYCEEKRLLYGARDVIGLENVPGVWLHRFLNTSFQNGATTLPVGEYMATTTFRSLTSSPTGAVVAVDSISAPTLHALRQLYELPSLRGVRVNATQVVGKAYAATSSSVLPHTVLFTAAGTVTGSHAYGTQLAAPVYGAITATQDVNGTLNGGGQSMRYVRFYARRFGESSGTLRVRNSADTVYAEIDSADFDALDEIVDGWREVTLTLSQPFSPSATEAITWQASNASALTPWEILGANGPSLAGAFACGVASYQPPGGMTLELTWKGPNQTSASADTNADATLLLSALSPAVSGFTSFACELPVTGIAQDCPGVNPACIPTAIYGIGLEWTIGALVDDFERESASGWTTATTGQAWSHFGSGGTTLTSQFTVADGVGQILVPQANASRAAYVSSYSDADVEASISFRASAPTVSGAALEPVGLMLRGTSISSYYLARVFANTNHTYTVKLYNPAGTELASVTLTNAFYDADVWMRLRVQLIGSAFRARLWNADTEEPTIWHAQATDATAPGAGWVGVIGGISSGNLNAPQTFEYDDLCVIPGELAGGVVEIQRSDEFDDWQTIYRAGPCELPEFCDYEARVGVETTYRIRTVTALNFTGSWSAEVTATITAPGVESVTGRPGVLIFTSNQDAASSLAYMEVWDRTPVESFTFPEVGFQELRTQYGRDFFVAFRPTERGGEQFQRTLLVNAAAIPLPSLGNFRSLRDLAWSSLPYICVRDELGNRWFANVAVPSGNVRRNRRLYLAEVTITEITDTPAPVT